MLARLIVTLALSLGVASQVHAQNVQGGAKATGSAKETAAPSGQTEAGGRGTEGGPTTAETGVEPRGTKVAPSTNSAQGGQEKQ